MPRKEIEAWIPNYLVKSDKPVDLLGENRRLTLGDEILHIAINVAQHNLVVLCSVK